MNRIIGSANVPAGTDRMRCQLIKRTLHIEVSGRAQSRHRLNVRNGSKPDLGPANQSIDLDDQISETATEAYSQELANMHAVLFASDEWRA